MKVKAEQMVAFRGPLVDLYANGSEIPALPTELRVFPAGNFESEKGPFSFDARAAELVMANVAERGVELPFDYNHGMTDAGIFPSPDPSQSAKAAGWFTPELRDGALYATNIRWTPPAAAAIGNREWRYLSPTFGIERDGDGNALVVAEADGSYDSRRRVCQLLCVALTNTPAMHDLDPIINRAGPTDAPPLKEQETMKNLFAKLGLSADATEAQALVAFDTLAGVSKRLIELTAAKSEGEALGTVTAWKASHEKVEELNAKVQKIEAEAAAAEVKTLVDGAIKDGKAAPAQRDALLTMSPASLKAFITAAPAIHKRVLESPKAEIDSVTLSAEEEDVCRKMGIDPAKFLAGKQKAIAEGRAPSAEMLTSLAARGA